MFVSKALYAVGSADSAVQLVPAVMEALLIDRRVCSKAACIVSLGGWRMLNVIETITDSEVHCMLRWMNNVESHRNDDRQ